MPDERKDLGRSEIPANVVRLITGEEQALWHDEEMPDVWQHVLESPLSRFVAALGSRDAGRCEALCAEHRPQVRTMADLLHRMKPSEELVDLVCAALQSGLSAPIATMPRQMLLTLFNGLVVLTRTNGCERPGELDDRVLIERAAWVIEQPWLDAQTRTLVTRARQLLVEARPDT